MGGQGAVCSRRHGHCCHQTHQVLHGCRRFCVPLQFIEHLLMSNVRTEDPAEANLFFVPALSWAYAGGWAGHREGAGQDLGSTLLLP